MALRKDLKEVLENSPLSFEEVRAFETGLILLDDDEQASFAEIIREDPDLIYPLYINFKAKIHAARGGEKEWMDAIEAELIELEDFMNTRRVGNEIK